MKDARLGEDAAEQTMKLEVKKNKHDVTFASLNGQPPSGTVQQKVEASNLDGISENSRVTVWGEQNANQITAKVVVYSPPRQLPSR